MVCTSVMPMALAPSVWPDRWRSVPPIQVPPCTCTGIDRDDQDGRHPHAGPLDCIAGEIGQTIIDEHRLQHHGGATEHLPHHPTPPTPDQLDEEALERGIVLQHGDLRTPHTDPMMQPRISGHQGQDQRVLDAVEIVTAAPLRRSFTMSALSCRSFHGKDFPSFDLKVRYRSARLPFRGTSEDGRGPSALRRAPGRGGSAASRPGGTSSPGFEISPGSGAGQRWPRPSGR